MEEEILLPLIYNPTISVCDKIEYQKKETLKKLPNGITFTTLVDLTDEDNHMTLTITKPPKPSTVIRVRKIIDKAIKKDGTVILPPQDVIKTLTLMRVLGCQFDTIMLDPWYNKGFGGLQDNYIPFFVDVIRQSGILSEHVYFWGFPEIVARFVERIPQPLSLVSWLTWYYKNNPSVIRGWRSSQNACLHLSRKGAVLHPERFLNEKQLALKAKGKLRYMPGPTSVLDGDFAAPTDVIEQSLLVGFVGRKEQTGHPSQKPIKVYYPMMQMSMSDGGLILDPMCGSGTVGVVSKNRGFRAILCDGSDEYTKLTEKRLGIKRLSIKNEINQLIDGSITQ